MAECTTMTTTRWRKAAADCWHFFERIGSTHVADHDLHRHYEISAAAMRRYVAGATHQPEIVW